MAGDMAIAQRACNWRNSSGVPDHFQLAHMHFRPSLTDAGFESLFSGISSSALPNFGAASTKGIFRLVKDCVSKQGFLLHQPRGSHGKALRVSDSRLGVVMQEDPVDWGKNHE
jgi:hypothetical protein